MRNGMIEKSDIRECPYARRTQPSSVLEYKREDFILIL